jgi:hypothetical protein
MTKAFITKIDNKLARAKEVHQDIVDGLAGKPFSWHEWERKLNLPVAEFLGITLISETQIIKRGYRLKQGAQHVGRAYYGAPIQRYIKLYVLEAQCVKEQTKTSRRTQIELGEELGDE